MDKKKAIFSILVLMLAFMTFGIINVAMGRPSLITAKLNNRSGQRITEINPKESEVDEKDSYSSVQLERILVKGDYGDDVKKIQHILKEKGYYNREISGSFDEELSEALIKFQRDNNLVQSGMAGLSTLEALAGVEINNPYRDVEFSRIIYPGYSGDDVKKLQDLLKRSGYYEGDINGVYDDATRKAVIALQGDYEISKTGNVGNLTKKVLKNME